MLHSLERVLPTSEMPELVNELDSVLLKHPTCLQQNHAGNRKNNGGFFKALRGFVWVSRPVKVPA